MEQKRPKVKFRIRAYQSWLPDVMESLDLKLDDFLDYIPKITKHQGLHDVKRLRCNRLSHHVIKQLHQVRTKHLNELYQSVCLASPREINKTYMIARITYVVCDSVDLMTARMQRNYEELLEKGPLKVIDIFGGSWRQEVKKRKGGKSTSSSKKPRKDRGLTVTGTIEALLLREQGASKAEIIHELCVKFPDRAEHAMKNTIGVQLSSHLKKKHGDKLKQIQPGRYHITG